MCMAHLCFCPEQMDVERVCRWKRQLSTLGFSHCSTAWNQPNRHFFACASGYVPDDWPSRPKCTCGSHASIQPWCTAFFPPTLRSQDCSSCILWLWACWDRSLWTIATWRVWLMRNFFNTMMSHIRLPCCCALWSSCSTHIVSASWSYSQRIFCIRLTGPICTAWKPWFLRLGRHRTPIWTNPFHQPLKRCRCSTLHVTGADSDLVHCPTCVGIKVVFMVLHNFEHVMLTRLLLQPMDCQPVHIVMRPFEVGVISQSI